MHSYNLVKCSDKVRKLSFSNFIYLKFKVDVILGIKYSYSRDM